MSICESMSFVFASIVLSHVVYKYLRRWRILANDISTLKGKRVLITGATSGIGQALANELLDVGCRLILAGRDINKLNKIKDDLEKTKLPTDECFNIKRGK